MNQIKAASKVTSTILKVIVIISAFVGVYLSAGGGRRSFMGGNTVFMYFTIQSNIGIAILSIVGLVYLWRSGPVSDVWFVIKFVGSISITLTGTVFCFVLAPTMGSAAWNIQNVLTHVVVPITAVIDFFVTGVYSQIKKSQILYVTIPPIIYVIYAAIGYVKNWQFGIGINYPYFFLNWGSPAGAFGFVKELPFMGCMWWILLLLVLLLLVSWLYLVILDMLKKMLHIS